MLSWSASDPTKKHEYELVNIKEEPSQQRPHAASHANSPEEARSSWTTNFFILTGCLAIVIIVVAMIISPPTNNNGKNDTTVKEYPPFVAPSTLNFSNSTTTRTNGNSESTSTLNPSCVGNRLESGRKLNVEQFLCDPQKQYLFGITKSGTLVYIDNEAKKSTSIARGASHIKLLNDATLEVTDNTGKRIWQRLYLEAGVKDSLPEECFKRDADYDCPYVQLNNDGVVVLRYVDDEGNFQNRDIHRIYDIDYKSGNDLIGEPQCIGERIQNSVKLQSGLFLCDHTRRYRFGLDQKGNLIYADDVSNKTNVFFEGKQGYYFTMLQDATFIINNKDGNEKWRKKCYDKVKPSPKCLSKPRFDCPYLHLHSNGLIVLNYIDEKGDWKDKKTRRKYDMDFS